MQKNSKAKCSVEGTTRSPDKAFQIVEILAENRLPMRLQEIAQVLGMPQSTVLRYLTSLIQNNYVYQEENTLQYALTLRICSLGEKLNSNIVKRNIAAPFMNSLANRFGIGSCFVIHYDYQAVYLDVIDSSSEPTTLLHIGKNAPLYTTSSGKLILNSFSKRQLEDYLDSTPLEKLTENSISTRTALKEELALVAKRGYATDNEECDIGVRCAGVPVFNYTDQFCAALTCFGAPDIITDERLKTEILPMMNKMAQTISLRFGSNILPEIHIE